jgi:hypothetical protein
VIGRLSLATAVVAIFGSLAVGCDNGSPPARPSADRTDRIASTRVVDPYKASLSFARCMRRHGVPHPDPDRGDNFHLTARDERLMRRAGPRKHEAAEKACFHYLKPVVSTKPLSLHAKALAARALRGFSRCMRARGYDFYGDPVVRNLSRGRAFLGFKKTNPRIMSAQRTERFLRARTSCERVLNSKLEDIIATDRGEIQY